MTPLFTKEDLLAKSAEDLRVLMNAAGLAVDADETDKEKMAYALLDAQAEGAVNESIAAPAPAKRKRGRPSKAELAAREAAKLLSEQNQQDAKADAEPAKVVTNVADDVANDDKEISSSSDNAANADEDMPAFISAQIEENARSNSGAREEARPEVGLRGTDERQPRDSRPSGDEEEVNPIRVNDDFIILKDLPEVPMSGDAINDIPTLTMPASHTGAYNEQQSAGTETGRRDEGHLEASTLPRTAPRTPAATLPAEEEFLEGISGVLEIVQEGYGFLRSSDYNYLASPDDIYVSQAFINQYGLRPGDVVEGKVRVPEMRDKFFVLTEITHINGCNPMDIRDRMLFEHLTPLFPEEKFRLCSGKNDSLSRRVVDLFAPIGKGQRALIVAQPKTGKTMLMKDIANAIAEHHPETYLMMLLIDERPEEVTDMARTVKAEVIASTFDEPASRHVKIAGIVLDKAKRLVECGHDVVIFLDSITRLARAYNTVAPASGKVLTGGVDANALQKPKRFFGAARNIEGGGSLTIIATALTDTGSKMDEVIFEEFKGTGNMELQLERTLANKRIFPAVNLSASSTRRDDLLQDEQVMGRMWILRNYIADMTPTEAMTEVKKRMEDTTGNEEFLASMNS